MPLPPLSTADLDHVLAHTAGVWPELKGARIFITGGTGFFGAWLLESLVAAERRFGLGLEAVVLTRHPEAFQVRMPHLKDGPLRWVQGDVRHFAYPDGRFTHIIHAGTTSGSPVPPGEMFETITLGTRRVLDFAVRSGVRSFLFVSSGAVYGRQPADLERIPETYPGAPDPLDPASAYGEGKRVGEWWCGHFQREHGLDVKIARCFAFVGPHLPLDAHFAVGNFIRDALAGGPIVVRGDGTSVRSYLYAADLAVAIWRQLTGGPVGRALNIGSEDAVTTAELARMVAAQICPDASVQILQEPGRAPVHRYVPDCSAAGIAIGLQTRITLPEAIRRTMCWTSIPSVPIDSCRPHV